MRTRLRYSLPGQVRDHKKQVCYTCTAAASNVHFTKITGVCWLPYPTPYSSFLLVPHLQATVNQGTIPTHVSRFKRKVLRSIDLLSIPSNLSKLNLSGCLARPCAATTRVTSQVFCLNHARLKALWSSETNPKGVVLEALQRFAVTLCNFEKRPWPLTDGGRMYQCLLLRLGR
jgi:hypothetical protein